MKKFYFIWWNSRIEYEQVDMVYAINIKYARLEAVKKMNKVDPDHNYDDEDIIMIDKDIRKILPLSDNKTGKNKKKYCFTWFCHHKRTEFLYAENKEEAKKMAVLIMRLRGGLIYDKKDIQELYCIDDKFYNMKQLQEEYESKVGKYFK